MATVDQKAQQYVEILDRYTREVYYSLTPEETRHLLFKMGKEVAAWAADYTPLVEGALYRAGNLYNLPD